MLALLEKRRKALAAEGLFDLDRKRPLPFLPAVIGVVTSPTGAVIRDIIHRLEDRCPTRVIVWPVPVQGEGAATKVAAAIRGFATHDPRPDLIIVARGGGSIEDLWAFNEEEVVRAAADPRTLDLRRSATSGHHPNRPRPRTTRADRQPQPRNGGFPCADELPATLASRAPRCSSSRAGSIRDASA